MTPFKTSTWGLTRALRDIENYRDFIRIIKREKADPNSKYTKWNLSHNYFYMIYFTMDVDETETQLPQQVMRLRLVESLAPLHRYLDEELGFAECLTPEFNQYYDDAGNPTLTYLISYRFSFNKISLWWGIKWSVLITALTILLIKLPIVEWIQNLI